ncbi:hypothetical protein GCM10023149_10790 [Mucilaginibacter gynuensis]|uniref:Tetratricopeptide repeat protein n=1 Tax=Mucilaginibacter gynuensis TaxID=1302236 RepID=A0ABP8G0N2_9SPHI
MKSILKIISTILFCALSLGALAQDANSLVKEGIELNNARNYTGAIEKYKAALTLEPANINANYQIAFSLNALGKGSDALPYLQNVVEGNASANIMAASYGLMGSIYDKLSQAQKSVDSYKLAIKADSTDHSMYYNLGLAYFRNRQYAEAEQSAIAAIGLKPDHAASIRLYALVTFHQNKRMPALLALCHFLWLEPTGAKNDEAYTNLQSILKGGELKAGQTSGTVSADTRELNQAITTVVAGANNKKYPTPATLLSEQLKAIFAAAGNLAKKQTGGSLLYNKLVNRYYKLAQTGNMPAFANYISQANDKGAAAFVKTKSASITALDAWVKEQGVL